MSFDIDFFRKLNNGYMSKSAKETTLYEIRNDIARTHMETIDYQPDTLVDGKPMPLIVMKSHGMGQDSEQYKKLEAPPSSTFNLGSKVECFGLKWLVTEINYNQEIKLSGKMRLCNYVLKWQDENGDIVEEDCVVSRYKTSASGEYAGKVVTVNDTRRNVFIQFNSKTASLRQGMRFFIDFEGLDDLKVYKLTDLNRTTYMYNNHGFFDLVCTEEEVDLQVDRPDLMIADYREPSSSPAQSIGCSEILYSDEPVLKVRGIGKKFTVVFYDTNGGVITTITPIWELVFPPDFEGVDKITILSQTGNEVEIGITDGEELIGQIFTLKVSANDPVFGYFENKINVKVGKLY